MPRRRKGRPVNGIVLFNKPATGSSNHSLQKIRWLFQAQKAGHTGALDPLASGMLPICLGEATKFSQFMLDADKTYEVTAKLGVRTTTSDADGEIVSTSSPETNLDLITQACLSFLGTSEQIPSMFSALKYQGKPLYRYAREGIEVPRTPRTIHVHSLTIDHIDLPNVTMTIQCSKGTYIRTIVDDLGEKLGCGAHVAKLHRTKVGGYSSKNMLSLDDLESLKEQGGIEALDSVLLPMDSAVLSLQKITIDDADKKRFTHGQSVSANQLELEENQAVRIYDSADLFLGVGTYKLDQHVHPKRVVVYPSTC